MMRKSQHQGKPSPMRTSIRNRLRDSDDEGSFIDGFEDRSSSSYGDRDSDLEFIVGDHVPTSSLPAHEQEQLDYAAYSSPLFPESSEECGSLHSNESSTPAEVYVMVCSKYLILPLDTSFEV